VDAEIFWRVVEAGMSDTNAAPVSQSYGGKVSESEDVRIPPQGLIGSLRIPKNAYALVVFVHGSGSSRLSPRNVLVARALNDRGIATLLFDLLTPAEEGDRVNVFDIPLLAGRLVDDPALAIDLLVLGLSVLLIGLAWTNAGMTILATSVDLTSLGAAPSLLSISSDLNYSGR